MKRGRLYAALFVGSLGMLAGATWFSLEPLPERLAPTGSEVKRARYFDRHGAALSRTYENDWNFTDEIALHEVPALAVDAFLAAEDRRFYSHRGTDWRGIIRALWQNLSALRVVSGGSTISEQVVRLLHPRPRSLWSRWLEMVEVCSLERRFSKGEILEFYLNQVPYPARRRGAVSAARMLFDRDMANLSSKEILALAVLVRAPSRLDPRRERGRKLLEERIVRLADLLVQNGKLSAEERQSLAAQSLVVRREQSPVEARHFLRFASKVGAPGERVMTTLDGSLQGRIQQLLDSRLNELAVKQVRNGAVLVVENESGEILAWVNGRSAAGSEFDGVRTQRQPGSALKPFLYGLALERGWTAATLLDDSPLARPVGFGLKRYRNFSGASYGPLRLRECLGNSLNIPAIETLMFVRRERFLEHLRLLGFDSLGAPADFYGDGLALGNGEVTLFELVRAYVALSRGGHWIDLTVTSREEESLPRSVYSREVSSVIAHILSDANARKLEFPSGELLQLPVQTAIKTGTASDYRDSWALGFSSRYTVGVWMGNFDMQPMEEVTGSTGPALLLRGIFADLERRGKTSPLSMSPHLVGATICRASGRLAGPSCSTMHESFVPGTVPREMCAHDEAHTVHRVPPGALLELPTPGLQLARDPRIPDPLEAFPFLLSTNLAPSRSEWFVDGELVGESGPAERRFLWSLKPGLHTVWARVWERPQGETAEEGRETERVVFRVR